MNYTTLFNTIPILLVDDEKILRDIGRIILEYLGYRVYLADDGRQALEVYAREQEHSYWLF